MAGILGALYVLHLLALWAEERGWIYYRRRKADPASVGSAFLELHQMVEPDKKHVRKAIRQQRRSSPLDHPHGP